MNRVSLLWTEITQRTCWAVGKRALMMHEKTHESIRTVLTSAGQFGIILVASTFSRVDRNTITTGVKQDGIVVTRNDGNGALSQSNYIGRNNVASNGWLPVTLTEPAFG